MNPSNPPGQTDVPIAVYHMGKKRLLLGSLGAAGFLALGIFLMLHEGPRASVFRDVLIFLCVVAPSAALLCVAASGLLVFGPAVILTDRTIAWDVSLMCKGELAWSEVESVSCMDYSGVWFVSLEPRDLPAFLARQPWYRRLIYRALIYYRWPVTPTCVPGTGLRDGSADAIAKHAKRCMRKLRAEPAGL